MMEAANWKETVVPITSSIQDVILNLNTNGVKIVLVADKNKLIGVVSDGDVRRGILQGYTVNCNVKKILRVDPLVVRKFHKDLLIYELMDANKIYQIPIVDEENTILGLHLWHEEKETLHKPNKIIIMAGGEGKRLRPQTENCPKPMLIVAGKPMLQHIIENAKNQGFKNFTLAINYLGHIIEDYFGDGDFLNINIDYIRESKPLGTAGALSLITVIPKHPFVVTNGDVITDIKYGEFLDFHIKEDSFATMAVKRYEWQNPFGVVKVSGKNIEGFEEKPITKSYINAGIYCLNPPSLRSLLLDKHCDMPTLFEKLRNEKLKTIVYPMHEPWLDVGRPVDLQKMKVNYESVD